MPQPEINKPGEPWLAAALSLLLPGLGQYYAGRTIRGLAWFSGALASLFGTVSWVLSENRSSPWEGLGWYAVLLVAQFGSWIDTLIIIRRVRPRFRRLRRPAVALALSVFFPGLGQAYVLFRSRILRVLAGAVFALPALAIMCGEIMESSAVPGWPKWLANWPLYIAVPAWGLLSSLSITHAWWFAYRKNGHRARLPRLTMLIAIIAVAAWANALVPWEVLSKTRIRTFQIPSESMKPTLLIGDRLWAKKIPAYQRGDIVVFRPPDAPEVDYIKRVVGLPGERILVRGTTVSINGNKLQEPWAVWSYGGAKDFGPFRIPEGKLFLMGDNRDNSRDSRYFGPVPLGNVFGRAYKLYWPFQRAVPLPRQAR